MSGRRWAALGLAGGRALIGAGLFATPRMATRWLGDDATGRPGAQVAIRGLGARDAAVGALLVDAVARDGDVPRLLMVAAACDLADLTSTLLAGDALDASARIGTIALAGGAAAAGVALALRWDA